MNQTPEQKEVSDAFLEGMQELFGLMFTTHIELCFLDIEQTDIDFYNESEHKKYLPPIELKGKVSIDLPHAENPKMGVEKTLTIIIPAKEFLDNGIEITPQTYAKFRQAKVVFENESYNVVSFKPKTLVAETYLFYELKCSDLNT